MKRNVFTPRKKRQSKQAGSPIYQMIFLPQKHLTIVGKQKKLTMLRWCRFSWRKNEIKVGQKERFRQGTNQCEKAYWQILPIEKSKAGLSCVGAGSLFRNGSQCCVVTKCHQSKAFSFSGSVKRISSSKSFVRCWSSISGIDSRAYFLKACCGILTPIAPMKGNILPFLLDSGMTL